MSKDAVIRQVPAVSRAVAILKYLARVESPVGVVQVASALKIIPSTCLHILRVLNDDGLVSFQPTSKKYQLGAGILALAKAFESKNTFVQAVRPHLKDISERHHCTSAAVEPSGDDHFIVISTASANTGMSVRVTVGMRVPAMSSATGRCLAAYGRWSSAELKSRFDQLRWQNPPKYEVWCKEVEETKRRGYGVDAGNYIRGITVIAAPIFDEGSGIIGGLAAVQLSEQLTLADLRTRASELQRAAAKVGAQLGYGRGE
jgi:DNA-binding IclR family transcriptional regulator